MADQNSSFMNYSKISEVINDWDGAINRFDSNIPVLSNESCFNAMIEAGLDNGFVNKYDQDIQSMVASLRNTTSTLSDYLRSMEELENDIDKDEPEEIPNDDDDGGDRGDRGDRGGGPSGGKQAKVLIDNLTAQFAYYRDMPIDNLNQLIDDMYVLAEENKVTLDELLNRTEFSSIIQEKILLSPNITDDLKELIVNGETSITQKILASILNAEDTQEVNYILVIDERTMMSVIKVLDNKAVEANVDINTFLQNGSNVKAAFKDMDKTKSVLDKLKEEKTNDKLMGIYNGDTDEEINESATTSIRSFLDQDSVVENKTVEDLLASKDMNDSVDKLKRTVSFLSNLNRYSDDGAKNVISNLLARNIKITARQ